MRLVKIVFVSIRSLDIIIAVEKKKIQINLLILDFVVSLGTSGDFFSSNSQCPSTSVWVVNTASVAK